MSEWISVEDRLPDKHTEVLTYSEEYDCIIGCLLDSGKWGAIWVDYESGEPWLTDAIVTHWMPLPELPVTELPNA